MLKKLTKLLKTFTLETFHQDGANSTLAVHEMAKQETPELISTDQQQLGEVYAKALFGIGEKSGSTEALIGELKSINQAIGDLPQLSDALTAPQISVDQKVALVEKAFSGKTSPAMLNFLKVVVQKDRFACLPAVAVSAQQMHDQLSGKIQATVSTAQDIDDDTRKAIADQLSQKLGKEVELQTDVDPSIIGGVVVRVGDTVYDSSVAGQLAQVRAKAMKKASDVIREQLNRFTNEN